MPKRLSGDHSAHPLHTAASADVFSNFSIDAYTNERRNGLKGKFSVQTAIAVAFLDAMGSFTVSFSQESELRSMKNPTGTFFVELFKNMCTKSTRRTKLS